MFGKEPARLNIVFIGKICHSMYTMCENGRKYGNKISNKAIGINIIYEYYNIKGKRFDRWRGKMANLRLKKLILEVVDKQLKDNAPPATGKAYISSRN